ncbi:hypothetical protein QBC38DRAFT_186265 [Podospora fimiseda]|uniref:Uncharacterized protein n=1 Tax=Podospora fimiseda TaxID=252190 RepID=A0AAN7BQN1_9PEZI|nr:hypothetical protein QBC38DRAFT_186265 [Podospora fimiseda]
MFVHRQITFSHPFVQGLEHKMDANTGLPSISSLNLPSVHPSPPPTPLSDMVDHKIWAPPTPPSTPSPHDCQSLPPIAELLKTIPSAPSRTPTPAPSPTTGSCGQPQQWPGVHTLGTLYNAQAALGTRSYSLPEISYRPTTPVRSSSVPDIRYWTGNSGVGPARVQPRRNSRQEPYARASELVRTKKSKKAEMEPQSSESEDNTPARNNTKYTDEQNHFLIYHHDDLEWGWKDIQEAYMQRWPDKGKEQPSRTGTALQCAFYRTNAYIPAMFPGTDLLVLGYHQDFIHGKPMQRAKDSFNRELSRESYELWQIYDGVPNLLEEVKVRAMEVARKLSLRYPEEMLNYDWVRPEDKLKAEIIAAKRQIQRQEWKQRFCFEAYKNGTLLHRRPQYVSPSFQGTPEPRYQHYSEPTPQHLHNLSIRINYTR